MFPSSTFFPALILALQNGASIPMATWEYVDDQRLVPMICPLSEAASCFLFHIVNMQEGSPIVSLLYISPLVNLCRLSHKDSWLFRRSQIIASGSVCVFSTRARKFPVSNGSSRLFLEYHPNYGTSANAGFLLGRCHLPHANIPLRLCEDYDGRVSTENPMLIARFSENLIFLPNFYSKIIFYTSSSWTNSLRNGQ